MKYLYCIAAFSFLLLSCSAENEMVTKTDQAEWVKINGVYVKKSDVELPRPKGALPYGHKVYTFMNPTFGVDEMDRIYREEFAHPDSLKLSYNNTVRQMAFVFMMNNGLKDKATTDQKRYYIDEQIAMKVNISGIENFYLLLASLKDVYSEKEIEDLALNFYDKNYANITTSEYFTDDKIFISRLDKSYKDFKSTVAMN
jgi:hypothetical protein